MVKMQKEDVEFKEISLHSALTLNLVQFASTQPQFIHKESKTTW